MESLRTATRNVLAVSGYRDDHSFPLFAFSSLQVENNDKDNISENNKTFDFIYLSTKCADTNLVDKERVSLKEKRKPLILSTKKCVLTGSVRTNRPRTTAKRRHLYRQGKLSYHIICVSLLLSLMSPDIEAATVRWDLKTLPIILGESTVLQCTIKDPIHNCTRYVKQWYGGTRYGLLCEDNMCRDNTSYSVLQTTNCNYSLVIRTFKYEHANINYTCSYGVMNQRKGLVLNVKDIIVRPRNYTLEKSMDSSNQITDFYLQLDGVYPEPSCFISAKLDKLLADLNQVNYSRAEKLYSATFNISSLRNTAGLHVCMESLLLQCHVKSVLILNETVITDQCIENYELAYDGSPLTVWILICPFVLCASIVVVVVWKTYRKRLYTNKTIQRKLANITEETENMSQFDNDITVSSNSQPKMKSYSRGIQRDDSSVEGVLYDENSC